MARKFNLTVLLLFGLFTSTVQAQIYKYIDEHGQTHYSSEKPSSKQYKDLKLDAEEPHKKSRKNKKIEILPTKDLEKAVREGKITQTVADRMQYFNSVSEEYASAKKKKIAMKRAISKAKSKHSTVSAEELKQLQQEYDEFVKEDFYYIRRNYTVTRQKLRSFLDSHGNKPAIKKKKAASINWNRQSKVEE